MTVKCETRRRPRHFWRKWRRSWVKSGLALALIYVAVTQSEAFRTPRAVPAPAAQSHTGSYPLWSGRNSAVYSAVRLLVGPRRGQKRPASSRFRTARDLSDDCGSGCRKSGRRARELRRVLWATAEDAEAIREQRGSSRTTNNDGNGEGKDKGEPSLLKQVTGAITTAFNGVMAAGTIASLFLAAEAVWQLHGEPLTLANAVPTLTKLLPVTGIGVFGAAQLVGLMARVVKVLVTLPIMVSGTWVILKNAPQMLPKGTDLGGAGSLAALLATPEVLEAAAVVALLGGTAIWAVNFATGAVGTILSRGENVPKDDELR